jgi:hypothetical protein
MLFNADNQALPSSFYYIGITTFFLGISGCLLLWLLNAFEIATISDNLFRGILILMPVSIFLTIFSKSRTDEENGLKLDASYFTLNIGLMALIISTLIIYFLYGKFPDINSLSLISIVLTIYLLYYFTNKVKLLIGKEEAVLLEIFMLVGVVVYTTLSFMWFFG